VSLLEILFPYRAGRQFGASSFALLFILIIVEIEVLVLLGLAIVARADLFIDLQTLVLPMACFVSLVTTVTFWWRARSWIRRRIGGR